MDIIQVDLPQDFETVELYCLSDLHVGTRYTDYKKFEQFIEYIKQQPNRYVIYAGDNMDNATQFSAASTFDNNTTPSEQKKYLKEKLERIADRILCIVPGNHELKPNRYTDLCLVETLAESLGIHDKYGADGAYLKITFGKRASNNKRQCYTVYTVHGSGSAKGSGGVMEALRFSWTPELEDDL